MKQTKQTIVLNGRHFDAHSGLPVRHVAPPAARPHQPTLSRPVQKTAVINDIAPVAGAAPQKPALAVTRQRTRVAAPSIHAQPQKSSTLRREHVKKPVSGRAGNAKQVHKTVERSRRISHFVPSAKTPENPAKTPRPVDHELLQQAHAAQKKHAHLTAEKPAISSRAIKEHLLKKKLEASPDTPLKDVYQSGKISRKARFASIGATSFGLILLASYLTYINIPNLSIRVAAVNAGIDATLPTYQPGGYRLHGPIAYSPGKVGVSYKENGGNDKYQITQKASDWDPQAALDNYVQPEAGGDYQIHSTQGLTIYTYAKKAVWVNGGILHVIEGTDPLSGAQVERIAASM